ncbi:MAG TPA: hypothetical protein ENI45_04395 [Thermoplasmatales archaeon]|nr:hypothetical protein [Thermoplasmatales archaeon]
MISKRKLKPNKRVRLRKPKKIYYVSSNKNGSYKEFVEHLPTKTLAVTVYALRWILFLVLVYIIISTTVMLFTESYSFLQQIVTLSIGGFFGFFMGYFGWIFAHHITTWLSGKKEDEFLNGFQF